MSRSENHKQEIKADSVRQGRDPRTRTILLILVILFFVLFAITVYAGFTAYDRLHREQARNEALALRNAELAATNEDAAQQLASQVRRMGGQPVINPDDLMGPQGPQGIQGIQGIQGLQGLPGRDGTDGGPGPQGERGRAGRDGVDGLDGEDGADGAPGQPGKDGEPGKDGKPGPQGEKGEKGDPGTPGMMHVRTGAQCGSPAITSVRLAFEEATVWILCNDETIAQQG